VLEYWSNGLEKNWITELMNCWIDGIVRMEYCSAARQSLRERISFVGRPFPELPIYVNIIQLKERTNCLVYKLFKNIAGI
jgi:hypothetical protein